MQEIDVLEPAAESAVPPAPALEVDDVVALLRELAVVRRGGAAL
ncbi:hypothetical protein [Nocardioides sp. TRM66260-LWL]|nr:hypothetical protein [Nocardioides sp. TRM66260-LWL]